MNLVEYKFSEFLIERSPVFFGCAYLVKKEGVATRPASTAELGTGCH
jgi:hypothetical protein